MTDKSDKGRVVGIGGVFFKSPNSQQLAAWYGEHLRLPREHGQFIFPWRTEGEDGVQRQTVLHVFPGDSKYFDGPLMVNYIVDDLDAILERLAAAGADIDPKREDHEYGRFAWVKDPEGNKIELWEPR